MENKVARHRAERYASHLNDWFNPPTEDEPEAPAEAEAPEVPEPKPARAPEGLPQATAQGKQ
jgi:hypothetical protein